MRRNLLVFRHAEAIYNHPDGTDFDRPLSPHGQQQVSEVAAWVHGKGFTADRLFASAARRTADTAWALAPALGLAQSQVLLEAELFLAPGQTWQTLLSQLPDSLVSVALVGHNPGLVGLCQNLTGRDDLYVDPADAVHLEIELANWKEVLWAEGRCLAHFHPG